MSDPRPIVMFVCVGNSARSQMAEGFARHFAGDLVRAVSGGTVPTDAVKPEAIAVMDEIGIDIRSQAPKLMTYDDAEQARRLVSMGCGVEESCPAVLYHKMEDWGLDDPVGKPLEEWREIRDEIGRRVLALLDEEGILDAAADAAEPV